MITRCGKLTVRRQPRYLVRKAPTDIVEWLEAI